MIAGFESKRLSEALAGLSKRELESLVQRAISAQPTFENASERISCKIEELKKSLTTVRDLLQQLQVGKKSALIEVELEEELAYRLFFSHLAKYFSIDELIQAVDLF